MFPFGFPPKLPNCRILYSIFTMACPGHPAVQDPVQENLRLSSLTLQEAEAQRIADLETGSGEVGQADADALPEQQATFAWGKLGVS